LCQQLEQLTPDPAPILAPRAIPLKLPAIRPLALPRVIFFSVRVLSEVSDLKMENKFFLKVKSPVSSGVLRINFVANLQIPVKILDKNLLLQQAQVLGAIINSALLFAKYKTDRQYFWCFFCVQFLLSFFGGGLLNLV